MRTFTQVQRANPSLPLKGYLAATALLAIFAAMPIPGSGAETQSAKSATSSWKTARTIPLKGLKVSLSEPVLVARSRGFLWFPTLVHLGKGKLLAVMSNYADVHTNRSTCLAAWSRDGGLTWSKTRPGLYGDSAVRLKNGDHILLPYYLYPQKAGMGAPYQLIPHGKEELRVVKKGITVTGWPRPDRTFDPKVGMSGFVFNGQTVALKDGCYLATLYGYFKNDKRYSLVAAESTDGIHWKIRSTIAGDNCKLKGAEGPCEAALSRLQDGRLMCVFRLASSVPYGQTWSKDEGKTWTEPVTMANAFSVQPSLAIMKDGTLALSGGRPGIYAWFNRDGTGKDWQSIDLKAHHNTCRPTEKIGPPERTSSYTEIVALDERNLLCIYDRIPNGWHALPKDSKYTNSVWVVRLTLDKAGKPLPK
jgi:hypothetical protein